MSDTYKVTPKIGLNVRSSPNGSIQTAIPYGSEVTSDGQTRNGWVHVNVNGKWGWSYGTYLKKQSTSKTTIGSMAAKKKTTSNTAAKKAAAAKAAKQKQQAAAEKSRAEAAGKLASFGTDLIFEVNSRKVMPARNWKRTQNARTAVHNILNETPRTEFQGPDRTETTLTVTFNAAHGVKPRRMIANVEKLIRHGKTEYLILGGQVYGWGHKWLLVGASETWDRVYNKGELAKATMDLTFEDYV